METHNKLNVQCDYLKLSCGFRKGRKVSSFSHEHLRKTSSLPSRSINGQMINVRLVEVVNFNASRLKVMLILETET